MEVLLLLSSADVWISHKILTNSLSLAKRFIMLVVGLVITHHHFAVSLLTRYL